MVENKPQKLMLKDTTIFENLDQLIANNSLLNLKLLQSIRKIPMACITQDVRATYSRKQIIQWMILMKFLCMDSIHQMLEQHWKSVLAIGKDVLYKVKNSQWVNWRKLLLQQAFSCTEGIATEKTSRQDVSQIPCFIIDDSDIPKRGKCIEMIGKIFSHVHHSFQLGYKSLNLAYWSGKHLLHLDFSYHVELGKKKNQGMKSRELKNRYKKKRVKNSPGQQRYSELLKKKTSVLKSMIRRAVKVGFKAQYILADSWFFSTDMAALALQEGLHLISRPKFNNWKYTYESKEYTIGTLIKKLRYSKKVKWNRHLRLRFISIHVHFKEIDYRVIYFKTKNRGSKWQAIITTDTNMSAQRAYKIYQTRWTIEVAYKELKQTLRYGKCQSRDFDAQIADATQCLMAYNMLSHIKAINEYQSIGALFKHCSKQWLQPTLMQRFWKMIYQAIQQLADLLNKKTDDLINLMIANSNFLYAFRTFSTNLTTET